MIEMTEQATADFVRVCRGKKYSSTEEMLSAFHDWVADVYGEKAVTINGKPYPPGTMQDGGFRGSILWQGGTAEERRTLKRAGIAEFWASPTKLKCGHQSVFDYCEECSMGMVKAAHDQLDAIRARKSATAQKQAS